LPDKSVVIEDVSDAQVSFFSRQLTQPLGGLSHNLM